MQRNKKTTFKAFAAHNRLAATKAGPATGYHQLNKERITSQNGPSKKGVPQKLTIRGVEYPSKVAAAKALGITTNTLNLQLKRGIEHDNLGPQRRQTVTVKGVEYTSIYAASKALGMSWSKIKRRVDQGVAEDQFDKPLPNPRQVKRIINGVEYRSTAEAARALEIPSTLLTDRLRRRVPEDQLTAPPGGVTPDRRYQKKKITINGVEYKSKSAAAEAIGISVDVLRKRIANEIPEDKLSLKEPVYKTKLTINGVDYPSYKAAAQDLGVPPHILSRRIRRGFPEDQLGAPHNPGKID